VSVFTANFVRINNKRALELTYKFYEYDQDIRRITIIVENELSGITRLPFAYQFLDSTDERNYPIVVIVAAPGVAVVLENFPKLLFPVPPHIPLVQVYRVQDAALIPPLGVGIQSTDYTTSLEINQPKYVFGPGFDTPPDNYIRVDRLPDGIVIAHPYTNSQVVVSVPQISPSRSDLRDPRGRFSFQLNPNGNFGDRDNPLVTTVKTPDPSVTVTYCDHVFDQIIRLKGPREDITQLLGYVKVYEVDDINSIPSAGFEFSPSAGWREITTFQREPPLSETLALAAFDLIIGGLPIVGTAAAVAEFVYGLKTGRDKWGGRLSGLEKTFLGIGALLPFLGVAGGVAGKGFRLLKRFGDRIALAEKAIDDLRRAGLSSRDIELIQSVERLIKNRKIPSREAVEEFLRLLNRVRGEYPTVEDILNTERSGFVHIDLQESYGKYLQQHKVNPATPEEWVRLQRSGQPREILKAVLGPDFAKQAKGAVSRTQYINRILEHAPRPVDYTDELEKADLEFLTVKHRDRLVDRMKDFVAPPGPGDDIGRFLTQRGISRAQGNLLKGNMGEIYSLEYQKSVLVKFQTGVDRDGVRLLNRAGRPVKYPSARLYTKIRVRPIKDGKLGKSVLFSDNIVARIRDGNLEIFAVCEVKSGYKGGQEATQQVFEWLEKNFEEGSEIIIPAGATEIAADGTERTLQTKRVFTYTLDDPETGVPAMAGTGRVFGFKNAERHLITAKGVSHLGLNSEFGVGPRVIRHELEVTSERLDYLIGRISKLFLLK